MSGPIVRKYGFPNFDKIFGERPLQHGVDEAARLEDGPAQARAGKSKKKSPAPAQPKSSKSKKS